MRTLYVLLVLSVCSIHYARAQGCSDAGFCTAGVMQGGHAAADSVIGESSWGASLTIGSGEKQTAIIVPQIEGTLAVGKRTVVEAKLPLNIASGKLGNHTGIGDFIATFSRSLSVKQSKWQLQGTLGARIGLGDASATDRGVVLPMPYQASLGTADLIAGVNVAYRRHLTVAIGYQQPLLQYNNNGYVPAMIYPEMLNDNDYFASRKLRRKGDVLVRIEGNWQWRKWSVAAGPLFIYHLGEDKITLNNGTELSLRGSDGLTLNLAGTLSYQLPKAKFDLLAGTPFVVRDYRPDGLTRAWVITVRYTHFKK